LSGIFGKRPWRDENHMVPDDHARDRPPAMEGATLWEALRDRDLDGALDELEFLLKNREPPEQLGIRA
jgi:hypothetical protein